MPSLPITFLTDYGYEDEFAGACRAVLARLAPAVPVVDLTHGIAPGDIRRGALALEAVAGVTGPAVHLAVIDPGVGGDRLALALRAGESFLVGPDNGLLSLAALALGGVDEAVDVSATRLRRDPVAPTFHGRDVFAPVAAGLASGLALADLGEEVEPASIVLLEVPEPRREGQALFAHVLYADRFGNLILDARPEDLPGGGPVLVRSGDAEHAAVQGETFADGRGGLVLLTDSSGRLALALDGGSAADLLGADSDDEIELS